MSTLRNYRGERRLSNIFVITEVLADCNCNMGAASVGLGHTIIS